MKTLSDHHAPTGAPASAAIPAIRRTWHRAIDSIPESFIALLARFSLAALFWNSGQTKVEGFTIDVTHGIYEIGVPHLADSAVVLFRDEYQVPLLAPYPAALLAATAEHVLPILLLLGLGTRFAALGLLCMTAVIQFFVYPGAYPTHGIWAAALLWLIVRGPGRVSLDRRLAGLAQPH